MRGSGGGPKGSSRELLIETFCPWGGKWGGQISPVNSLSLPLTLLVVFQTTLRTWCYFVLSFWNLMCIHSLIGMKYCSGTSPLLMRCTKTLLWKKLSLRNMIWLCDTSFLRWHWERRYCFKIKMSLRKKTDMVVQKISLRNKIMLHKRCAWLSRNCWW